MGGPDRRRRALRLLDPALQPKLPVHLLGISLTFLALMVGVAWSGLLRPYSLAIADLPPHLGVSLSLMARDLAGLLGVAALAYGLIVVAVSVAYLKQILGPIIAFRR